MKLDKTEKLKEISTFRRILPQVLASSAKNLLLFDLGLAVAFPTIVIPALRGLKDHDKDSILEFTAAVSLNYFKKLKLLNCVLIRYQLN